MCYNINGYTGTVNRLMMRQTDKDEKGIQEFENGDVYEGEFLNDMMHGQGTYTCKNGTIITGQFVKNNFTGSGVIEYKQENKETICSGNFINGQINGDCQIQYQNGDLFQGKIINNQFQSGIYKQQNETIYEGQFSNQLANGSGKFYSIDFQAQGEFQDGFLKKGELSKKYNIYTIKYNGELSDGICQGFGKSKLFLNKRFKKLLKHNRGQFNNNKLVIQDKQRKQKKTHQK